MSVIVPAPQKAELIWDEKRPLGDIVVSLKGYMAEAADEWLRRWGLKTGLYGSVSVQIIHSEDAGFEFIQETNENSDEKYVLKFCPEKDRLGCVITCSSKRGLRYGLNTLARILKRQIFVSGKIEDYPLFSTRGFIEGFYGRPWTKAQREDMFLCLSKYNMNTYYYGPKDDIYHRDRWADLYDTQALAQLEGTVRRCLDCGIDFVYCVGPGITMEYSNPRHLTALMGKISQVYGMGVRSFSLFLDDIPPNLQYEADMAAYTGLTQAHISIVRRFYYECKNLDKDIRVSVCPFQYCGTGQEEYISALGRAIPEDIALLWTGRDICSREISAEDAARFVGYTGRMPAYWDNYPVNDANMYNEMHLGPIIDRDPRLYRFSRELIANGMEYCESSKVGFITIADYLWNPPAYDPPACWKDALIQVAGEKNYGDFIYFADHLLTSCLRTPNSAIMGKILSGVRFDLKTGRREEALEKLMRYTARMDRCLYMLTREMENRKLRLELDRWIEKFALCCSILNDCADYLAAGGPELPEIIRRKMVRYRNDSTVLTNFCFQEFVDMLLETDNSYLVFTVDKEK